MCGLHNTGLGNRGLSAAGENGSFVAMLLRMTGKIITAQDDTERGRLSCMVYITPSWGTGGYHPPGKTDPSARFAC